MNVRLALILASALTTGACDGCACRELVAAVPREWYESPPDDVVARIVSERLKITPDLATTACGVKTTGLTDVTVTPKKVALNVAGQGLVRVQNRAVGVEPKLVCTAVVSYLIFTHRDVKDGPATYKLQGDPSLYAVETPGVKWTAPSSSSHHGD